MISLPIQWMRSMNPELKSVAVEMDSENRLRIVACDTLQDSIGCLVSKKGECQ